MEFCKGPLCVAKPSKNGLCRECVNIYNDPHQIQKQFFNNVKEAKKSILELKDQVSSAKAKIRMLKKDFAEHDKTHSCHPDSSAIYLSIGDLKPVEVYTHDEKGLEKYLKEVNALFVSKNKISRVVKSKLTDLEHIKRRYDSLCVISKTRSDGITYAHAMKVCDDEEKAFQEQEERNQKKAKH